MIPKVIHLLASNTYSGAENVVCQIIDMFKNDVEMAYCSPSGPISQSLKDKNILYYSLEKLNKKCIKKVIEEYKPDVIHAHDVKASILASQFSDKCKIISHIHGNDERKMGKLSIKSFLYNLVSKKFKRIFWVSNSCYEKYYFKNKVKNKSEILYNIINLNKLYETASLDNIDYNNEICYLGRLVDVKNPIRALEIMKLIIDKRPKTKCAIIGDGLLRDECEKFVKDNKLEDNIKFFGFIKNPYQILKQSKVLLMSSINEGTPMAVLEAFALGVPLVSTKVDGALELINNKLMGSLYETNEEAVNQLIKILEGNKKEFEKFLYDFSKLYNDIDKYKAKILSSYKKNNSI